MTRIKCAYGVWTFFRSYNLTLYPTWLFHRWQWDWFSQGHLYESRQLLGNSILVLLENPGPICLQANIDDHTVSDDVRPAARSKVGIPIMDRYHGGQNHIIENNQGDVRSKNMFGLLFLPDKRYNCCSCKILIDYEQREGKITLTQGFVDQK